MDWNGPPFSRLGTRECFVYLSGCRRARWGKSGMGQTLLGPRRNGTPPLSRGGYKLTQLAVDML